MPAVLAFEKGRARDWALRRICRKFAARAIACELTMAFRHCPGHLNPTDRGRRAADRGEIAPGLSRRGNPRLLARLDALLEASPTVGLPGDPRPVLRTCPPTAREAFPGVPDHFPRLGIPGGTTFNFTREADRHRSQVIGARARARPGRAWLRVDERRPCVSPAQRHLYLPHRLRPHRILQVHRSPPHAFAPRRRPLAAQRAGPAASSGSFWRSSRAAPACQVPCASLGCSQAAPSSSSTATGSTSLARASCASCSRG